MNTIVTKKSHSSNHNHVVNDHVKERGLDTRCSRKLSLEEFHYKNRYKSIGFLLQLYTLLFSEKTKMLLDSSVFSSCTLF